MRKAKLTTLFILTSILLLSSSLCFATTPTPVAYSTAQQVEKFLVTLTKFQVKYAGDSSYTTVWTGEKSLDIASTSIGHSAGAFFSGMPIDSGKAITDVIVTAKNSCTIRGYVTYSVSTFGTTGANGGVAAPGVTAADSFSYDPNSDPNGTFDIPMPVNIPAANDGATRTVKLTFNMTGALGLFDLGMNNFIIVPVGVQTPTIEVI
jgi:hypothetical protein